MEKSNTSTIEYLEKFYTESYGWAYESAKEMVPIIIDLINPKSIIDVGCGLGAFLSVFEKYGISDYYGIDSLIVNKDLLKINKDRFLEMDFITSECLRLDRKFDLAVSLEVAEHLPERRAECFVDFLMSLSDVVVFSAAIPGQRGTNHLNERWQSYWAERFKKRNYVAVDILRPMFWYNLKIKYWYSQNTLIYVNSKTFKKSNTDLLSCAMNKLNYPMDVVHPRLWAVGVKKIKKLECQLPVA